MATIVAAAGGGNWTVGATWIGGVAPTAADDAQLVLASGNVTIDAGAVARSLDANTYTGTLTHNAAATLTLGDATAGLGNIALRFVAGMTYTLGSATTSAITFISTSATVQTVDFAGKTTGNVTYNASSNGSWQLTGTHNTGSTATVNFVKGTLDWNGQTLSWGIFDTANSNVRVLTMGASNLTLTASSVSAWNGTSTNQTITANTATVTLSGAGSNWAGTGTTNYNGLSMIMSGSGSQQIQTAPGQTLTFANVTRTGTAVKTDALTLSSNTNLTVTGTFTVNGNSAVNRVLVTTSILGSTRTISAGTVTVTNADFRDITAAGAGSWNLSAISGGSGDSLGNTGITFTAPVTRFWVGGTGSWSSTGEWSASSGGASGSSVPLPQDTVIFDANSFAAADTVSMDMPRLGASINATGVDTAAVFDIATTTVTLYGSMTLQAGMGAWTSGLEFLIFEGRGVHTVTTAGVMLGSTINMNVWFSSFGGTYTFQDGFTTTGSLQVNNGTLDVNNFNVSARRLTSTGTATRALLMGSGTWTLNGTTNVWSVDATGFTLTPSTSTILITDTSASTKTFTGAGLTYNNLTITGGGAGSVDFIGSNTFNIFTINAPKTVRFTAATTTTVTQFNATGSLGNIITISSITAAQHTLSKAAGIVSADWLNLTNSNAIGGAAWYAGANSVDNGGNAGWIFAAAPGGFAGQAGQLLLLGVGM